jgi:hypothetical protein
LGDYDGELYPGAIAPVPFNADRLDFELITVILFDSKKPIEDITIGLRFWS